jgi:quercetin dioxygenase-like cupin family protein
MASELPSVRRVITGFDASGRSVFVEDAPAHVVTSPARPGLRHSHLWATGRTPAPVDAPDPCSENARVMPPPGGSTMTVVDLPPEPKDPQERERALADMKERIRKAGLNPEPGVTRDPDGVHPGMHKTDTIDYAIVLAGEVYAVMENGEKLLRAGDVLIQRGTNHAWSNRSDRYCRMAFVLVEARR